MTRPKAPGDLQRPQRRLGDVVRGLLFCPVCRRGGKGWLDSGPGAQSLRVVAYRQHTIRVECPVCGLRFSLDRESLDKALDKASDGAVDMEADWIWNRHETGGGS